MSHSDKASPVSIGVITLRNSPYLSVGKPNDLFELDDGMFFVGDLSALDVGGAVLLPLLEGDEFGDFLEASI